MWDVRQIFDRKKERTSTSSCSTFAPSRNVDTSPMLLLGSFDLFGADFVNLNANLRAKITETRHNLTLPHPSATSSMSPS